MGLQDNLLTAESGVMKVTPDKRFMEFKLRDGWRYEERGNRYSNNTDFIRLGFKEYTKMFDLSSFKMNRTEDSLFKYDPKMLSVRQLNKAIDSIGDINQKAYRNAQKQLLPYLTFIRYQDSSWNVSDSLKRKLASKDIVPDSMETYIYDRALSQLNSLKTETQILSQDYKARQNSLRSHWIEWNRKFTLSVACIVLFMIGAPLGSIIRKGGLGTPLIFAIVFFVLFHLLNTFGEKFAKEGVSSPGAGMWLSTAVLIPIGLFLTWKAMHDSQLFNKEFYYRSFKKVKQFVGSFNKKKENAPT